MLCWSRILLGLVVGISAVGTAGAADDPYLSAIQAEGQKLPRLDRAREEIRQSEKQEEKGKFSRAPTQAISKDIVEFETLLRNDSPASHALYLQLPTDKRLVVYELHRKGQKMSVVKRKIVDAHLGI